MPPAAPRDIASQIWGPIVLIHEGEKRWHPEAEEESWSLWKETVACWRRSATKSPHWSHRKALTSRKRTSCPAPFSSSQPSNCNVSKTMRRGFRENCRSPVPPRVPLGGPILFVLLSVQMFEKCHRRFQNIHKENNRCSHSFKHLRDLPVGPGSGKASKALILAQNFRGAKRNSCSSQDRYYSRQCFKKAKFVQKKKNPWQIKCTISSR